MRVSRDGEVLARLAKPAGMVRASGPHFSPDGSRLYFNAIHEDDSWGLWWMPANGGDATNVVANHDPELMAWQFQVGSENIYFIISEWESDIWVMDLEW